MRDIVTVSEVKHPRYRYRVTYPDGEERKSKYFKNRSGLKGADAWATKKRKDLSEEGAKHAAVTEEERNAVLAFRNLIATLPDHAKGITLKDAVGSYAKSISDRNRSIECEVVADKLLKRLKNEKRSTRHRDTIKSRLKRFNSVYGGRLACDISTEIIDDFIIHLDVSEQTQLHYRRALGQMFNHAIKLKAAPINPVNEAIQPKVVKGDIGVLSPEEVANLLSHADDATLPALAISFFAGVRRAELERLDWADIKLHDSTISIRAKVAKSSRNRHITISDNLKAWLEDLAQPQGLLIESSSKWRTGLDKARKAAKITDWPHNAGRHSFASYHFAHYKDQGALAAALGHPDARLLFSTYRALVSKKEAQTYWSIKPEQENNVTSISA